MKKFTLHAGVGLLVVGVLSSALAAPAVKPTTKPATMAKSTTMAKKVKPKAAAHHKKPVKKVTAKKAVAKK